MPNSKVAASGLVYLPLSGGSLSGSLLLVDGSSVAPSLGFVSEPGAGLYRVSSGRIGVRTSMTVDVNLDLASLAGQFRIGTRCRVVSLGTGKLLIENYGETSGAVLDVSTDGKLIIRNRADSGPGELDCAGGGVKDVLLASVLINVNTATKQDIYTVPAGKSLVITKVIQRNASATLTPATSGTIGSGAGCNNWITDAVGSVDTATCRILSDTLNTKPVYVAGDVIGWLAVVPEPTSKTVAMSLFGYLI